MNKAQKKLKDCIEYCKEQNGLDYCKNCGLSIPMINDALAEVKTDTQSQFARKGGKATAKRGSDYFRQLQKLGVEAKKKKKHE